MMKEPIQLFQPDMAKLIAAILASDGAGKLSEQQAVARYKTMLIQVEAQGVALSPSQAREAEDIKKHLRED